MSGPADVIWLAGQEADAHIVEDPPGSNVVKYWDWWYDSAGVSGAGAWCATFVSWVFAQCGVPLPAINGAKGFTYCPDGNAWPHRNGEAVSDPQPGDIIIYSWYSWDYGYDGIPRVNDGGQYNGDVAGDHTGIFVGWNGDGSFTAVEGNTSESSWDNGGAVMRRSRWPNQVCCWWHPSAYANADPFLVVASTGPAVAGPITADQLPQGVFKQGWQGGAVRTLQTFLTQQAVTLNNPNLDPQGIDGDYGPNTARAVASWQRVIFPQASVEWDGEWGPRTFAATQVFLSGTIIPPPEMPVTPNPPPDATVPTPAVIMEDEVLIINAHERPVLWEGKKVYDIDFAPANGATINGKMYQSAFIHISPEVPEDAVEPYKVDVFNVGPSDPNNPDSAPAGSKKEVTVYPWGTWIPVWQNGRLSVVYDGQKPVRVFVREGYFLV